MNRIILLFVFLTVFSCKTKEDYLKNDKNKLIIELKEMYESDQYLRVYLNNLDNLTTLTKDSIWDLISKTDFKNTKRLIDITNKYGFPNVDRIGQPIPIWLIFHHSPYQLNNEVVKIVEQEYKAGRLPHMEYNIIKWHLNGRIGNPMDFKVKNDTINN